MQMQGFKPFEFQNNINDQSHQYGAVTDLGLWEDAYKSRTIYIPSTNNNNFLGFGFFFRYGCPGAP
jgi:hypothetical protein